MIRCSATAVKIAGCVMRCFVALLLRRVSAASFSSLVTTGMIRELSVHLTGALIAKVANPLAEAKSLGGALDTVTPTFVGVGVGIFCWEFFGFFSRYLLNPPGVWAPRQGCYNPGRAEPGITVRSRRAGKLGAVRIDFTRNGRQMHI